MNRVAVQSHYVYPPDRCGTDVVVLAVGDVLSLRSGADTDLSLDNTAFADFADVTPELVEALDPEIVISSVLGRNFDCVDLAERLALIGFSGRYRLIAHGIPQPNVVIGEIRALFPSLRVELDSASI